VQLGTQEHKEPWDQREPQEQLEILVIQVLKVIQGPKGQQGVLALRDQQGVLVL
jgi:hypothetical protein